MEFIAAHMVLFIVLAVVTPIVGYALTFITGAIAAELESVFFGVVAMVFGVATWGSGVTFSILAVMSILLNVIRYAKHA